MVEPPLVMVVSSAEVVIALEDPEAAPMTVYRVELPAKSCQKQFMGEWL